MRFYTAHLKPHTEPVLVKEGFSWAALLFGPFWLALHRAWIAAALTIAAAILIATLAEPPIAAILLSGLALSLGFSGHDLRRWTLDQRGYLMSQVFAARDADEALLTLMQRRPDVANLYRPEAT